MMQHPHLCNVEFTTYRENSSCCQTDRVMPLSSSTTSCLCTCGVSHHVPAKWEKVHSGLRLFVYLTSPSLFFFFQPAAKCGLWVWCSPSIITVQSVRDWWVSAVFSFNITFSVRGVLFEDLKSLYIFLWSLLLTCLYFWHCVYFGFTPFIDTL